MTPPFFRQGAVWSMVLLVLVGLGGSVWRAWQAPGARAGGERPGGPGQLWGGTGLRAHRAQRAPGEASRPAGLRLGGQSAPVPRGTQPPTSSSEAALMTTGRQVYEANCAVCHGVRGDGQGMAAHMFTTQPRDFRAGVFKFRSTPAGSLPRDADLLRVVRRGVRRTAMVPQTHLSDAEQQAVIAYLKTLAPRWQQEEPEPPIRIPERPPRSPTLVALGRQIYDEIGCAQCHGPTGRGDGPQAGELKDDWGQPILPANLQQRPFKGGSTLADIYRTLVTGLDGTPMPSLAEAASPEELWALVYYVDSLAPPAARTAAARLGGDEARGRMVERMSRMMGRMPMMERMMRRRPMRE